MVNTRLAMYNILSYTSGNKEALAATGIGDELRKLFN